MEPLRQLPGMRIIDCFPFFNEMDLLRLRIEELKSVVSHFVLVEAVQSHSGAEKPLYFDENRDAFSDAVDQITDHQADLSQIATGDPWVRERAQRDAILVALEKLGCEPGDIILLSDADEIPREGSLSAIQQTVDQYGMAILEQTLHRFFLNNATVAPDNRCGWCGTIAIKYADLQTTSPSALRSEWCAGGQLSKYASAKQQSRIVRDAGWHLTYMGGREAVVYKRQNFAHTEGDDPQFDRIKRLSQGASPMGNISGASCRVFGGACPCGCVWGHLPQAYDESSAGLELRGQDLPSHLLRHRERFSAWIRTPDQDPSADPISPASAPSESAVLALICDEEDLEAIQPALSSGTATSEPWWICDIRTGHHSVPKCENANFETNWFRWPSRTPGQALNALLAASQATQIKRWRRDLRAPVPVGRAKDLLEVGGYDEFVPVGHDWVLWHRRQPKSRALSRLELGTRWLERFQRRSAAWEAQIHVARVELFARRDRHAPKLDAWATRCLFMLWVAKERIFAKQYRTAIREFLKGAAQPQTSN